MKTTLLTLSVLAAAATLHAAPARASAMTQAWEQPTMPTGLSVHAGSAPIEQALSTIIPVPYRIALDQSVPASAIIVWPAGNDWMKVLRAAVAPLDLYVEPDWKSNTIRVVHWSPGTSTDNAGFPERRMPTPSAGTYRMPASGPVSGTPSGAPGFKPLPTLPAGALPIIETLPPGERAPATAAAFKPNPHSAAASVAAPPAPGASIYVIPSGTMLSQGLTNYVKRFGWSMRWNVKDDYMLDAPLPIPAGSVSKGVTFVVHTYQMQGGLLGDTPLFATPNRVVVIQPAAIREN